MSSVTTILPSTSPVSIPLEGSVPSGVSAMSELNGAAPTLSFTEAFAQLQLLSKIAPVAGSAAAVLNTELAATDFSTTGNPADSSGALGQWLGLVLPPDGNTLPSTGLASPATSNLGPDVTSSNEATMLMPILPGQITGVTPVAVPIAPISNEVTSSTTEALRLQLTMLTSAESGSLPAGSPSLTTLESSSTLLRFASNTAMAETALPSANPENASNTVFDAFFNARVSDSQLGLEPVRHELGHGAINATGAFAASDASGLNRGGTALLSTTVTTPMTQPQWSADVGERIVYMVKQDMQHAEIRLNPPHMGPIEVRLSMQNDQAHVILNASHAVTRDALEAALPKLREMFADAGLTLNGATVTGDTFADQRQREQAATSFGESDQNTGEGAGDGSGADESEGGEWRELPLSGRGGQLNGLDVFA